RAAGTARSGRRRGPAGARMWRSPGLGPTNARAHRRRRPARDRGVQQALGEGPRDPPTDGTRSGRWTRDPIKSSRMLPSPGSVVVSGESTTVVVQRYLDALAGDAPAEPIIRELLA